MSVSEFFVNLLVIGLIATLIGMFITKYIDVEYTVKESEEQRYTITLAQLLLSSEKLVFSDGNHIYRDVLDTSKLNSLRTNPKPLFSEIGYPGYEYSIDIRDLENSNEWRIGQTLETTMEFPVAIRYEDNDIHTGLMSLGLKSVKT